MNVILYLFAVCLLVFARRLGRLNVFLTAEAEILQTVMHIQQTACFLGNPRWPHEAGAHFCGSMEGNVIDSPVHDASRLECHRLRDTLNV